jgi:hypothetical protein
MKKIFIFLLVIVCGFLVYRTQTYQTAGIYHVSKEGVLNVSLVRHSIEFLFQQEGGVRTYEEFKKSYKDASVLVSHPAAHLFGEILYKRSEIAGIGVCDSEFGFGCYHGFFGSAVRSKGEVIVMQLDEACVNAYGPMGLGCPHGIGHGLGEYFGPSRIQEQLDWCEKLTWKGRFFGCQGGVFMEYNTPVITSDTSVITSVRPWDMANPYGICLSVSENFQPACFLELSGWWSQVIAKDYEKMGVLCQQLVGVVIRESCFLGIGYTHAALENYDVAQVHSICGYMPLEDSELLCRAGASWSFFANPAYRAQASLVCAYPSSRQTDFCLKKADLLSY